MCFPIPLCAHENHLLDTSEEFFLKFEGNAKEYNDEASVWYDNDDDESSDDALSTYNWFNVPDSFERKLRRQCDEKEEAEQTQIDQMIKDAEGLDKSSSQGMAISKTNLQLIDNLGNHNKEWTGKVIENPSWL